MKTRLISMSLYGEDPTYLEGAVINARLLPDIYPGWKLRVYCERGIDTGKLVEFGSEVVRMPRSRRHAGMFWRFLPAWEMGVEFVIFRDADSRLNVREAAAVEEWVQSSRIAHCMHDHPHHVCMPIMGGMWGIRAGHLPPELLAMLRKRMGLPQHRVEDMKWLRDHVYPLIRFSVLRHTFERLERWGGVPFPEHPPFEGFVGEKIDVCCGAEVPSRKVQPTSQKSSAPRTS